MKTITFDETRNANPGKIIIGVRTDNEAETLRFELPALEADQLAVLYWTNGVYGDVATLEDGIWTVDKNMTRESGRIECFVRITHSGNVIWNSQPFELYVVAIPAAEETIEKTYPSAIQQGVEEARSAAQDAQAAADAARESAVGVVTDEAARREAENARLEAEILRESAEAGRVSAESARESAETARVSDENSRSEAESAREIAEAARVNAENSRVAAENERVAAEQGRVAAENERVAAFAGYQGEIDGIKGDVDNIKSGLSIFGNAEKTRIGSTSTKETVSPYARAWAGLACIVNLPEMTNGIIARVNSNLSQGAVMKLQIRDKANFNTVIEECAATKSTEDPRESLIFYLKNSYSGEYFVALENTEKASMPTATGDLNSDVLKASDTRYYKTSLSGSWAVLSSSYSAWLQLSFYSVSVEYETKISELVNRVDNNAANIDEILQRTEDYKRFMFGDLLFVGDSRTAGVYDISDTGYVEKPNYSYPAMVSRIIGANVVNSGMSGATVKNYWDNKPGNIASANATAAFIWIGINDIFKNPDYFSGTVEDVNTETYTDYHDFPDTSCGNLGKIISYVKETNPLSKIFVMTLDQEYNEGGTFRNECIKANEKIKDIANYFGCEVIDLYNDEKLQYATGRNLYWGIGGCHMTTLGYLRVAKVCVDSLDSLPDSSVKYVGVSIQS